MAICFIVDRHSLLCNLEFEVTKMDYKLDKIWVKTLGRITNLEKRVDNVEKQDRKPKPNPKSKSSKKK